MTQPSNSELEPESPSPHASADVSPSWGSRYLAEALGTFAIVFAGTGAIIVNDLRGHSITHVGIALSFGLAVAAMIYALGEVSGAHFNPAVSLAFWFAGRFPRGQVLAYALAQCAGALGASMLLRLLLGPHPTLGATVPSGSVAQSFGLEAVLTLLLMLVILSVSHGSREKGTTAGLAIGGTVALEALFAGPICGASMNPARSLAPALVAGVWAPLWIYLLAPTLGALLSVPLCRGVHGRGCCSGPA